MKYIYILSILWCVLSFNVNAQDYCNSITEAFFEECKILTKGPQNKQDVSIVENTFICKSVRYNVTLLNIYEIELLLNSKVDTLDIIKLNTGILLGDSIIYDDIKFKRLNTKSPEKYCDNINFYIDSLSYFYEITNYSELDMQNALGLIIFKDKETMLNTIGKIDINDHYLWELNSNVSGEDYEEITHRETALINIEDIQVLFQVNGVRYNSNDREYLYSNIVSLKKRDEINRISYMTSNGCIEGHYTGY